MSTYRFSWARTAMAMTAFLWLAWATQDDNRELKVNRHEVAIEALLTAVAGAACAWLLSLRLRLDSQRIEYRSLFGSSAIQWRDVTQLFLASGQRHMEHSLLTYTVHRVEIVSRGGRRLVFGNRFRGIAEIADIVDTQVAEHATPRLLRDFQAGRAVSFGAVTVSQSGGVEVNGPGRVAWADLVSFQLTPTELALARRGAPPLIVPRRRISMPAACDALIAEGLSLVRRSG